MALTTKKIRDAKPGPKTYILWDDNPMGLGLRVWPSGKKVFILNYRLDGRSRRMNLGVETEFSLEQVREVAREAMRHVRTGVDPLEERKIRKTLPTVSDGLDQYLGQYVPARQKKGRMAKKTVYEYTRQIEINIRPIIGNKRIQDVGRGDVEKVLKPLSPQLWRTASAPYCRHCLTYLSIGSIAHSILRMRLNDSDMGGREEYTNRAELFGMLEKLLWFEIKAQRVILAGGSKNFDHASGIVDDHLHF